MDEIRKHFEEEAERFDATIVKLIPYYTDMIDALVSALPFAPDAAFSVLDLGCGTGTVSARILERFPGASVTCLDIADNMLEMAKLKLAGFIRAGRALIEFVSADFALWNPSGSGTRKFDAVVSSLAIHHLADDGVKQAFFRKVFELLGSGGVFLNADVVLSGDDGLQRLYLRKWKDYMLRSVPAEEIDAVWFPSYERQDRPSVLCDQLDWLGDAGFIRQDVIWKYYNFAVYGGKKP